MNRLAAVVCLLSCAAPVCAQLSEPELRVWNDPAFKRQFVQSYVAETEIEPRVTGNERKTMEKVLEEIGDDDLEKAAKLLEKNRGDAASAVFDFTLANIRFQQERLGEAAAYYEVAVKKYPNFRRAWRNLAMIRIRQNDDERALHALTRVVELGGGDRITYGLLGFAHTNVGNAISAESAYRMAILLDPTTLDWKIGLARSFFNQDRYAEAAALCGNLIEGDPERTEFWLLQANAYIGLQRPLEAAENFEIVDRLGGSTADSLVTLGNIYVNEGLFELAVDSYVRSMTMDENRKPDRMILAAKALASRGEIEQTRRLVEAIDGVHGDRLGTEARKDLLKLRARIAVADGASEEEAQVLEDLVRIDPLDGEALILLGGYYRRIGEHDAAINRFEQAAGLEKYEAEAKRRHAQLLVGLGRYADALPLLRAAQQIEPREAVQTYLDQIERLAKTRAGAG